MKIIKLVLLLTIGVLFSSGILTRAGDNKNQQETEQINGKYRFTIEFKENKKSNSLEEVTIKFENNCESIALNNFLLNFYSEKECYWGINDDFRFTPDNPLILTGDTIITKTLKLESFKFKSMKTDEFKSLKEMMNTLQSNPEYRIVATIGDPSKSENPYESSLLTRSNMITIKTE